MSKNAQRYNSRRPMIEEEGRLIYSTGAFGRQLRDFDDPVRGRIFNPYTARAGEIRACARMTEALLREGEVVVAPPLKQVVWTEWKEWACAPNPHVKDGRFFAPWLTKTRVGGRWSRLRPVRVARESTTKQVNEIERQKALVGWLNTAADLAEEMKAANDRLGMRCLRMFFMAGVQGDGGGPNSPYCSHVSMNQVVGRMSPGRLVRRMVEVRFAALRRMRSLVGVIKAPSWAAVAVAAVQNLPVGKASIVAMAMTLSTPRLADGGGELRRYRAARQWLADHLASATDKVEGIDGVATVTRPSVTVGGVQIARTVEICRDGSGNIGGAGRCGGWIGTVEDFVFHGGPNTYWADRMIPQTQELFAEEVLAEHRNHLNALSLRNFAARRWGWRSPPAS